MFVKILLLFFVLRKSAADPESTEAESASVIADGEEAAAGASPVTDTDEFGPFESLIKKCDGWEFPESSFSKQPDADKVYLKVDRTSDGPFKSQNITKFASVFGIRVVADEPVDEAKVKHVANTLAKVLDSDNDGKPDNQEMVNELLDFHPILFIISDSEKVMELMNAQNVEEGFPLELKFCPFAFDFEEDRKINPGGGRGDATCEDGEGEGTESNDRTLAFVLDHLMGRGFNKVLGEEKRQKLVDIYRASLDAGTFEPENTGCPPESDECGQVMFASWGLSTLLGFDKCWCEAAHALKFCDKEALEKGEEDLVDLLKGLFPRAVEMDDSQYDPKDKSKLLT